MSELPAAVHPLDEHNRRLLENVHPPDWSDPSAAERYHLVVVGAGTGGLVTAAIAASLGARVALIERELMGGDCLNVGCVPSKALLRAARAWYAARTAQERFGGPPVTGPGDFSAAAERMRRLRADLSRVDSASRFRELGADVFLGDARFTGRDSLTVGGQQLRFRRAVIATGARAAAPPIAGLAEAGYLTNESVFSLTEAPNHLLVLGAGPIGAELAQAFARFGSRVSLLDTAERVLPREDADAARVVQRAMERDGVRFIGRAQVQSVLREGNSRTLKYTRDGEEHHVCGDQLLVAVGRAPNVDGLGLDAAEVRFGPRGVAVDDRMRTSNARIFAVGDVASRYQFTHAADAQARIVVQNALFYGRGKASELVMPWCTYTDPELAHVGLTAEVAGEQGVDIDTITIPLAEVDRAVLDGAADGFLRVHLKRGSDRILGATLVAENAGDLISQITHAIVAGEGLGQLGKTIFPYPTQAEVVRKAADAWRRRKLTSPVRTAFGLYFRLVR